MTIQIKNKAIPSSPRSKNYPTGAIVSVSSGGGSGVACGDIIYNCNERRRRKTKLTDSNVLSSPE